MQKPISQSLIFAATKVMEMLETILISVLIVASCVALLAIGILIKGKFPNIHVGGNKAMRERGIGCVQSQDYEARRTKTWNVSETNKNSN